MATAVIVATETLKMNHLLDLQVLCSHEDNRAEIMTDMLYRLPRIVNSADHELLGFRDPKANLNLYLVRCDFQAILYCSSLEPQVEVNISNHHPSHVFDGGLQSNPRVTERP